MNIIRYFLVFIFSVLLFFPLTPPAHCWIIVLNGTSSAGKSTLARNLKEITKHNTELLSWDVELAQALKEKIESLGYIYDEKLDLSVWLDSLPKELEDKIDWSAVGNVANQHIIEKAQKFNQAKVNVIVDTLIGGDVEYELLNRGLPSDNTYFILTYASIAQLLKNVKVRNSCGKKGEEREYLSPFEQFFLQVFTSCEVTSSDKLDILTKKDFENTFGQLEVLIPSDDKNKFKVFKSKIEALFFHGSNNDVGIMLKLPKHDFVINTGTGSSIECAKKLDEWLMGKIK